jgi:hypothetical protein
MSIKDRMDGTNRIKDKRINKRIHRPAGTVLISGEEVKLRNLPGYYRLRKTKLQYMYNYGPLVKDLRVFTQLIAHQLASLMKNTEDIPEDFYNFYEYELPLIAKYIQSWIPKNLVHCDCVFDTAVNRDTSCIKCFAGRTGGNLYDYINTYYSSNHSN